MNIKKVIATIGCSYLMDWEGNIIDVKPGLLGQAPETRFSIVADSETMFSLSVMNNKTSTILLTLLLYVVIPVLQALMFLWKPFSLMRDWIYEKRHGHPRWLKIVDPMEDPPLFDAIDSNE